MKKVVVILSIVIILYSICSTNVTYSVSAKEETRGVFVSYIELSKLKGMSESDSKKYIKSIINNTKKLDFNLIILQVRSFSDALYYSDIYPSSSVLGEEGVKYSYDVLNYFIKTCKDSNIKLIAWINPYRIRTNENIDSISTSNPAYKYIGTDYVYINKGIYYNPSKKEVEDLIVNCVSEIISNYKVDGVLFDDYFYPDKNIDINDYNTYNKGVSISLDDYHLMIIKRMIRRVYEVCNKKNVSFGISPDGNINNNYEKHYLDVKELLSSSRYVDFIMPQVYYGFFNESKNFYYTVREWDKLISNDSIDLYVALAFYKVGKSDNYAISGRDEWIYNNDIIMRQIVSSRNLKHYKGFSLFRYGNLFDSSLFTDNTVLEIQNMKKILK